MIGKDLNFRNFMSDLIFHPEHAKAGDRRKSLALSVSLGVLTLGVFPLCVAIGWGARKVCVLLSNLSKTDKKTGDVANKNIKKDRKLNVESPNSKKVKNPDSKAKNPNSIPADEKKLDAAGYYRAWGPGFLADDEEGIKKKDKVREETINKMESYALDRTGYYTSLTKHIEFRKGKINDPGKFIAEGDVIQTPVKMDYDHLFNPMESKNLFYMHSTPAPNAVHGSYVMDKAKGYNRYLEDMRYVMMQALTAQIESGAEHILWNYFGMGAFLRGTFSDQQKMIKLRNDVANIFVEVFDEALHKLDKERLEKLSFYMTGPTGDSFIEAERAEPQQNYQAFCEAFKTSKFKRHITLCGETDAYVKGQQLADLYKIKNDEVAPVSVINAANPARLGNRWDEGYKENQKTHRVEFNAKKAIDENAHRRSAVMALYSRLINEDKKSGSTCCQNIENIKKTCLTQK